MRRLTSVRGPSRICARSMVCIGLVWLVAGLHVPACGQLRFSFGPQGQVQGIRVGGTEFFRDASVAIVAPGWNGTLAEQEKAVVLERKVTERSAQFRLRMPGQAVTFEMQMLATWTRNSLAVDYVLTPSTTVSVESALVRMHMAVERHAGSTRYLAPDVTPRPTVLPRNVLRDNYVLVGSGASPWVGFVDTGGGAVQVVPRGAALQLQDDRKWNVDAFELFAATRGGILPGGRPIRFGVTVTAFTAKELLAMYQRARGTDFAALPMQDRRPLSLRAVSASRPRLRAYETIELASDVTATYNNPFDPDQIAVEAEIRDPVGALHRVPGFYYVPARLEMDADTERLRVAGRPGFRVRFTPSKPGRYTATVVVRNASKVVRSAPIAFVVEPSQHPGFVRVSRRNPHYFAHEDGSPFIAVGENVCWASSRTPLRDYQQWFEALGKAGGNWARLWLAYNEKGQEWTAMPTERPGTGTYLGLGRYAMDNAWRLDEVLRLAEKNGIHVMFCLGTYGEFTEGGYFNEGMWVSNPYNAKNGGPCATPQEFWTNERARKLYKQRLRYLIARYAHSPNLFAWEFWNEVPPSPAQEKWVTEMAAFVKQNDPYKHLVSTTYGSPAVWQCADVDFTMTHMYGQADSTPDFTPQIVAHAREHRRFGKPYLLSEFGIDWQGPDSKWEPAGRGINMHNGAWAALMAGSAGTAMVWWWDSYVHPFGLYHILSPVARFAKAVDWQSDRLEPLEGIEVQTAPETPETFKDLVVSGDVEWGLTPGTEFTIRQDGRVEGRPIPMAIGSPNRSTEKQLHSEITYHLDMPRAGTIRLKLGQVCTKAHMVIKVDGQVRIDRVLTAGEPGAGPWKAARKLEQYGVWVSDYDEEIPLEIPAGKHTLSIANTDGDWFQIRSITLPCYQSSRYPDVNALGLGGERTLLLWLHNRESTWKTAYDGKETSALEGLRVRVPVSRDGTWEVQWWDTWTGKVLRTEDLRSVGGAVLLLPPALKTDVAVLARLRDR